MSNDRATRIGLLLLLLVLSFPGPLLSRAADSGDWKSALGQMRFASNTPLLQRSNVISHVLRTFRSNDVLKGIVVLPGVADDLYLIHRDSPPLNLEPRDLAQTLAALTNATPIRLAFLESFLLLHTSAEPPLVSSETSVPWPESVRRVHGQRRIPSVVWEDVPWSHLQPRLQKTVSLKITPTSEAELAWHFERVNLAACNLLPWELLQAVAWSTGTELTVRRRSATFSRASVQ